MSSALIVCRAARASVRKNRAWNPQRRFFERRCPRKIHQIRKMDIPFLNLALIEDPLTLMDDPLLQRSSNSA